MLNLLVGAILSVIVGFITAGVAKSKGRNYLGWWIYGVFFSVIALVHAILVSPSDSDPNSRKCPFCAERIKAEATVCRYCSRELSPKEVNVQEVQSSNDTAGFLVILTFFIAVIFLTAFIFLR